jgi:DNA polymerase-3 subunit delta'
MPTALIGNARAVDAVRRALGGPSPPHAWLFIGPDGVGKAALARWLAQAVNCESVGQEPCAECAQCDRIARGVHADVSVISVLPPEDGVQHKDISVDQVREIERAVALAPFEGRTRVVIIDPADAMSVGAQNAFLKTLEEPPPHTVFVLVATAEDLLLPTVHSRCRRIDFSLVPVKEIEGALTERDLDAEQARLVARLAGGRPERALELAEKPAVIQKRQEVLAQARELGGMPMADLMDLSERLAARFREDREAVLSRLDQWLSFWRDVVLVQSGAEGGTTNVDLVDELRETAGGYSPAAAVAFVRALLECRERLDGNVQARIALDAMLVQAPRPGAAG